MIEIVRMYLFDGIDHTTEDPIDDLERDAFAIVEKIAGAPIARSIKAGNPNHVNDPLYEEIIKTIKLSDNWFETIQCETVNMVKPTGEWERIWK